MIGDALDHAGEVVTDESPVERLGGGVVAVLEGGETIGDLLEVRGVVGSDDFALDDGEDDLDLVLATTRGSAGAGWRVEASAASAAVRRRRLTGCGVLGP